jgi:small subunit ribosomal protein S30
MASTIIKQLNRTLISTLGADNRHLYELDMDLNPRIEAFWFVGGIIPPFQAVRIRRRLFSKREFANDPVLRGMQYVGKPVLTLRHQHPLKPFVEMNYDELTTQNENIPSDEISKVDPYAIGWTTSHRHGVTVPGFWPGNVREYGLMSFYDRKHILSRPKAHGIEDDKMTLHSHAITSAYAWLFGQATYQGFSTFNDLTYPLSSQNIVTDGQTWSFYRYQMNTTVSYTNVAEPNYKFNQCWGTDEMKLFEHVDENGKVHGFNDDVLRRLIQFYINAPKQRNYEMKPFLDPNEKKIADIEDVDRRQWLEKTFKRLTANRVKNRTIPEVYSWEKIYKIDNKTRAMDKKRRFFELGINPFQRRLNEHYPQYIPRQLRAGGIYDRKRFRATYYPLNHRSNEPRTMSLSLLGAPDWGLRRKIDRFNKSFK